MLLYVYQKSVKHICLGVFLFGLDSIFCPLFICLSLFQYHTLSTTIANTMALISDRMTISSSFFFVVMILGSLGYLPFNKILK